MEEIDLANKKKKKKNQASIPMPGVPVKQTPAPKRESRVPSWLKKPWVIAVSALLLVGMVVGIVFGAIAIANRPFDFIATDLSRYVPLLRSDYEDLTIEIDLDHVTEADVERRILQTLVANKNKTALYNGTSDRNRPIALGDMVKIWYRGYYMEDGKRVEFDGGNNIVSENTTEENRTLEIGAGSFVAGFEQGLIGIVPEDYSDLVKITKGEIGASDTVYLRMSATFPDGTTYKNKTVKVDLSDPMLEEKFGVGFAERVVGKSIGNMLGSFTTELRGASAGLSTAIFSDVCVLFKTTGEEKPLTVEARFPLNHAEEELKGREVFFEVYISGVVHYDTPELTESFLTEKLSLTKEKLASYEGEDMIGKYRSYVHETLVEEYNEKRDKIIEDAVWAKMKEVAKKAETPRRAVRMMYEEYLLEFENDFEYYKGVYGYTSIEQFAADTLSISDGSRYKDYIWTMAQSATAEKMTLYYAIQLEGIVPTDDETAAMVAEKKDEMLAYYRDEYYGDKYDRANYKSDAEYEKAIEELKGQVFSTYDEQYFIEEVHYAHAMKHLVTLPTIVDKAQ